MTPKGQHLFEIYTTLSYVRVASYTSHTLPCLNTKQVAVKVISKDQQPYIIYHNGGTFLYGSPALKAQYCVESLLGQSLVCQLI